MERSKRGERSGGRSEKRRDHRRDGDADYRDERREKKDERRDRDRDRDRRKDRDDRSKRERDGGDERHEMQEQPKGGAAAPAAVAADSTKEIEERIARMKESRKKKDEEDDVRAWVEKSRKIEKEKVKKVAPRSIAEQGDEEEDEEDESAYKSKDLAGMKIRHGLEKIVEGGEVVLTLKDSRIITGDDLNEEADELENVNIAEQTLRSNAYRESKKKIDRNEDKFQNDINSVKSLLPQYDEVPKEEGIQLDESGEVSAEGQKRLEEVRQKLQGAALKMQSLLGGDNKAADFYTKEEMTKFAKPKKKKKLRKKDMLDVDALEAEAKAAGLGAADLGSRTNPKQELDADDDEMYNRLKKSRELAIKKLTQSVLGPQAIANRMKLEAADEQNSMDLDNQTSAAPKTVVITETEEFCLSLQPDEAISRRAATNDTFEENEGDGQQSAMETEQEEASASDANPNEASKPNEAAEDDDDEVDDDLPIKEVPVGKGLAGALGLLKERGSLKESVEWGGRNMDKKPSKLVGLLDDKKYEREIQLDRRDEYGRTLTPKEAFRIVSHKFHGKNPGKRKQEKKMKQHEEELKQKQMTAGDTPLKAMEKMREVQMKTSTPYIVMSGHIKPGQTSDPRSGFATVEKESIGSLTPMLGDKKVEHFLGIKRPPGDMGPPPLPKKKPKQ